jgi:uncharacterized membrane protein
MRPWRTLAPKMELLALLAVLVVISIPILSIAAFVRVQKLRQEIEALPLQNLTSRLYSLEQRLASIEKMLSSGPAIPKPAPDPAPAVAAPSNRPVAASTSPAPSEPTKPRELPSVQPRPAIYAAPPLHAPSSGDSSPLDFEALVGGRWLNRIAIVALILAVSFGLKYAFDNNWIGPGGRVGIGILLGASMLPWSQWLLTRGYSYFSEGIAALGAAVLYLSIWAGCRFYTLFTPDVGFAAMILITAAMAAVALGRNSQRIALLSLFGGFLTPILLSTGKDEQVVLFTYLLILGAGMLIIAARREWLSLAPISFLLTQIYFWGWYSEFYKPFKLERTMVFATLFFILYAILPVVNAVRHARLHELDILVTLANALAYLSALYVMLWPQDRWPLTLLVLALSAAYVAIARLVPAPKASEAPLARLIFAGLALTFATLAIPIRLDGKWMTLAFAVEGAILAWTGFRAATGLLRGAGYLLLAISAMRVLVFPLPAATFLFNERFATYAVLIACFGAVLWAARQEASNTEENLMGFLAVAINVYAVVALSLELWDYFGHGGSRGLAQHLALSLLWTGYATALLLLGVRTQSALLRWQALALYGLAVIKVFFYDSSFLERFYRIVSFFILGLVLLFVSFLYQRKLSGRRTSS